MEQKTGIRSLYDEFFRGYGAEIRLVCPDFRPNSTYKRTSTPSLTTAMQWNRVRFTVRKMMVAVAVVTVLMGASVGLWRRSLSFRRLAKQYEQMGIREHLRMKQAFPFMFDYRDTAYYSLGEYFSHCLISMNTQHLTLGSRFRLTHRDPNGQRTIHRPPTRSDIGTR